MDSGQKRVFFPHYPKKGTQKPPVTLTPDEISSYIDKFAQMLFTSTMTDQRLIKEIGAVVKAYQYTGKYTTDFLKEIQRVLSIPTEPTIEDIYQIWAGTMLKFEAICLAFDIEWKEYRDEEFPGEDDAKVSHQLSIPDVSTASRSDR